MNPSVIRAIEIEMQRQAIVTLIVLAVIFALGMWVLYHVIRCAVRDGLQQSGLIDTLKRRRPGGTREPTLFSKH